MIDITHIHPMLVHFPIVFFISATLIFLVLTLKSEDLAARECLQLTGTAALAIGLLIACLAAFFGDIALDAAVAKGFAAPPLERHEEMAMVTLAVFSLLTGVAMVAIWKKIPLAHRRAWCFLAVAVIGIVLLLVTAYLGGELVYGIGVNVDSVIPIK